MALREMVALRSFKKLMKKHASKLNSPRMIDSALYHSLSGPASQYEEISEQEFRSRRLLGHPNSIPRPWRVSQDQWSDAGSNPCSMSALASRRQPSQGSFSRKGDYSAR
jgi:hypothetical protein